MEAFSLLNYWRSNASTAGGVAVSGVKGNGVSPIDTNMRSEDANLLTTTTTIKEMAVNSDEGGGDGDDGPFFDMEFTVPAEDVEEGGDVMNEESDSTGTEEEEREFNFTVSSSSAGPNLSPSDDLFFKGEFVPIDHSAETQSKLQFPGAFLKPATKLRVFMLGFKKAKSDKQESNAGGTAAAATTTTTSPASKPQQQQQQSKSFTVKFKVEEVPIVSLFTRENSSKIRKQQQQQQQSNEEVASEEKRFAKDVLHKYLKMVKPLYVRVSKRYEKLGFSGQLSLTKSGSERVDRTNSPQPSTTIKAKMTDSAAPKVESVAEVKELLESKEKESANVGGVKGLKQGNLTAGLRVVCKHLGKSRSASSAVAAAPPSSLLVGVQSKRQDDSLLQQQDGIQSAILHCKRSFNGSRDSDSFSRSTSDPSHEKSNPSSIDSSSRTSLDLDERKAES